MSKRIVLDRRALRAALVTVVSTVPLAACVDNELPPAPLSCADVQCPTLPGVAESEAQLQGNACVCVAKTCLDGYENPTLGCPKKLTCPLGYRQEGSVCLPAEDVSCYDVWQSPICIPTDCAVQPTARDGTDLRALGKCVDREPVPTQSCTTNCHNGIEDPHPWFGGPDLTCTGCHGGNAQATTRIEAHAPLPTVWQVGSDQNGRPGLRYYWNYNTLFGVENFAGGLEWLRFRNPGDLRVAEQSCGKSAGCHKDRVENVQRGVMATEVGLVGVAQARAGVGRTIVRGPGGIYKWDTTEAQTLGRAEGLTAKVYDESYVGSMPRLTRFSMFNRETNGNYNQVDLLKEIYDKQCGDCHLGNAGANNRYADFRSSGCTACHMTYALDGKSRSSDQMIVKNEPTYPAAYAQIANFNANDLQNLNGAWLGPERAHPAFHRLTRQMTSQRCGTCHVGSNRTDWQYRGYIIDPNRTALTAIAAGTLVAGRDVEFTDEIDNNANPFARYHGQAQNQVLRMVDWDQDGTNDIPADVHYQAGLECLDCHTTGEMHNELKFVKQKKVLDWKDPAQVKDMSGAIWAHMDQATEVECVHCHGNLEYRAVPFEADNRNPVKNLIACAENGETITYDHDSQPGTAEVPYRPSVCDDLGRGRFLRSKFTDKWHYVPQTKDTVADLGVVRPKSATPVYNTNASIFHGRYDQDAANGVGPCANGNPNDCFLNQTNNQGQITQGFSHLGKPATSPVDQHAGGLECYACHATWQNGCFGCHLTLADTDGNNTLRDFSRSTGEYTYGVIAQADFTYISPRDMQYGINSEGKIAQFQPETKMNVRHIDVNNNSYFGTQVIVNNNANIQYNVYRDRAGYGLRQYATEPTGLPLTSDGQVYEQDARMDVNAGQGFSQFMPHSVQRSSVYMDCTGCHLDAATNGANLASIQARFGAAGFVNNTSAYLTALNGLQIVRNNTNQPVNVNSAQGFRFDQVIDPQGFSVDQQSDWVVSPVDGFPYAYNNHPMKLTTYGLSFDPQYTRQYPIMAQTAGPLNLSLLNKMLNQVRALNEGVQNKGAR